MVLMEVAMARHPWSPQPPRLTRVPVQTLRATMPLLTPRTGAAVKLTLMVPLRRQDPRPMLGQGVAMLASRPLQDPAPLTVSRMLGLVLVTTVMVVSARAALKSKPAPLTPRMHRRPPQLHRLAAHTYLHDHPVGTC